MNGPRLVVNATIAGVYGALLLAEALAVLHPAARPPAHWAGLLPVVAGYALAAGLLWPLLYGAVRFFARHTLRVPLFSLRYVMSFNVLNTAVILGSLGLLLASSRRAIDPAATVRLRFLLGSVAVAWAYGALLCVLPRVKRSALLQASAAGVALAALVAPLAVRLPGAEEPGPAAAGGGAADLPAPRGRLVLLVFDGADLEDLLPLCAEGRLPVLERLQREGTFGRLLATHPGDTPVARAVLATGQLPFRSGVRGDWSRDLLGVPLGLTIVPDGLWFDGLLAPVMTRRPVTVGDRRVPALWDLAARAGGVAIAGGWDVDLDQQGAAPAIPRARRVALAAEFMEADPAAHSDPVAAGLLDELARALDADAEVLRVLESAAGAPGPGVIAVSFPGLDRVAHLVLRAARPEAFGDVDRAERERYGQVLARYYERVELIVERGLAIAGPGGWLLVASSHGMEPAPPWRRLAAMAGATILAGAHDDGPPGMLVARGPEIRAGASFSRAPSSEVVPTALHLLGLPIARDFDGSIMEQVLDPERGDARAAVIIETYGAWP